MIPACPKAKCGLAVQRVCSYVLGDTSVGDIHKRSESPNVRGITDGKGVCCDEGDPPAEWEDGERRAIIDSVRRVRR